MVKLKEIRHFTTFIRILFVFVRLCYTEVVIGAYPDPSIFVCRKEYSMDINHLTLLTDLYELTMMQDILKQE